MIHLSGQHLFICLTYFSTISTKWKSLFLLLSMDESLTTQSDSRDKEKGWSITQLVGNAPFRGLRETIFKKKKNSKRKFKRTFLWSAVTCGRDTGYNLTVLIQLVASSLMGKKMRMLHQVWMGKWQGKACFSENQADKIWYCQHLQHIQL